MFTKKTTAILFAFLGLFLIYYSTSAGNTPYNYFNYFAERLLVGELDLVNTPNWLNELAPFAGKKYLVYPPMPSVLLLPFVALWGVNFPQQFLAHTLGAGITLLTYKLALNLDKSKSTAAWISFTLGLGSIVWYMSSTGSAWVLGQLTASFFITLGLVEATDKKRPVLVGAFLGMAFLARLQTILFIILFSALYLNEQKKFNKIVKLFITTGLFVLINMAYNHARFGTITNIAYKLIPGVLEEPWYQEGLFSISYIPRHLKIVFTKLPKLQNTFPFFTPSWGGLAIWITTPAFIIALKAKLKNKTNLAAWGTIVTVATIAFMYGSTGFTQFGYRYAVDFYPALIFLMIQATDKPTKWYWILSIIGFVVNLWGVVWINKFGWVGW